MIPCIFSFDNGRKLEPLTCSEPVPLFEVCGKPIIEYTIDTLIKNGSSKAVISLVHKKEAIEEYFKYHPRSSFEISFDINSVHENEDILLINANTLYSISLENALKFHKETHSELTVITNMTNNCRNKRAVFTDKDRSIISFHDNPDYMDCISSSDTEIYLMSYRVFRHIMNSGNINAKILNNIVSENFSVYAYECTGYCRKINTLKSYIKCQRDVLCQTVKADIYGHRTLEGNIIHGTYNDKNTEISGLISIGNNVSVNSGTIANGFNVIGDNVTIGKNSSIHNCIIMDGVFIGDGVSCTDSVICKNAVLLNSSSVNENCIIGENAVVGENTAVKSGVNIWNNKNTGSGKIISHNLKYGHSFEIEIDEAGICGETNAVITPHSALSAGAAFAEKNHTYIIGHSVDNASYTLAHCFADGIMSSGGNVLILGQCIQCETDFAIKKLNADGGAYIQSGNITKIIPFSKNGTQLSDSEKSALEYSINHESNCFAFHSDYGYEENISAYHRIYFNYLNDIIPQKINFSISVNSSDALIKDLCVKLLQKRDMKYDNSNSIVFNISSDGRKVSAYSERSGFIFHERLIMLCCDYILSKGNDLTVPQGTSSIVYHLADKHNKKILSYCGKNDYPVFFTDGLALMCETIKILCEKNIFLKEASDMLPEYAVSSKLITIEKPSEEILKQLYKQSVISNDGTVNSSLTGNASIKPSRSGKSIMIYSEAAKYEYAKELCDFVADNINKADMM